MITINIEIWYSIYDESWVVQIKDDDGNQVNDATYVYTKREAISEANVLAKEYDINIIKIFTRDDKLQKVLTLNKRRWKSVLLLYSKMWKLLWRQTLVVWLSGWLCGRKYKLECEDDA